MPAGGESRLITLFYAFTFLRSVHATSEGDSISVVISSQIGLGGSNFAVRVISFFFQLSLLRLLILMPMVDIWHVSVLVLGARMFVFVGVSKISLIVGMELFMLVYVLMHHRHMDMKMRVLFIR